MATGAGTQHGDGTSGASEQRVALNSAVHAPSCRPQTAQRRVCGTHCGRREQQVLARHREAVWGRHVILTRENGVSGDAKQEACQGARASSLFNLGHAQPHFGMRPSPLATLPVPIGISITLDVADNSACGRRVALRARTPPAADVSLADVCALPLSSTCSIWGCPTRV